MQFHETHIDGTDVAEQYLTAAAEDIGEDPVGLFAAIVDGVDEAGGRVCRERIFVPDGKLQAYQAARRQAWDDSEPVVPPTWLRAGPAAAGSVQAHAIIGLDEPETLLDAAGRPAGLLWSNGQHRWAITGGIYTLRAAGDEQVPARQAFELAEGLLGQADMRLSDVARTWFFLDDILSWYDPFNAARNSLFKQRGLLEPGQFDPPVPASTGIGISPACGSRVALEVFAVSGPGGSIVRRPAAGRQRCPYEYGSAFARAAAAASPAGRTVFVSGTAAIDTEGRSCFLGDSAGQIRMTIDNVLAVLGDMNASSDDVVQAMAYCKTPAVAAEFKARFQSDQPWPWVVAVGDVCRDDLLFEAEVTTCQGGK